MVYLILFYPITKHCSSRPIYLLHIYETTEQNNKLKTISPTWNDEFKLADGSYSVSDIQNYVKYITKHETLPTNAPIHIYINRINNRVVRKK